MVAPGVVSPQDIGMSPMEYIVDSENLMAPAGGGGAALGGQRLLLAAVLASQLGNL